MSAADSYLVPDSSEEFKAGFVALMGRPNVGKSTLINTLLNHNITAVSKRPQTTRKRQIGILTLPAAQIIFEDTPGVHKPLHKLGECMNQEAVDALQDADLVVFLVDASRPPNDEDHLLAETIARVILSRNIPVLLVLNKIDLLDTDILENHQEAYQELIPQAEVVRISAIERENLDTFLLKLQEYLPVHPPFFPIDQITDLYEREIAADFIRAASMEYLHDEIPFSIAVRIDEFHERDNQGAFIGATLFVERESQKGIVIGQGGSMLKAIGTTARREIEAMSGRKVYLKLRVKVRKNWRNDRNALQQFGYNLDKVKPLADL